MKRHHNLWQQIVNFPNLLIAAQKAQKGKRMQSNVADFNIGLEHNLFQILSELEQKTYGPGPYKSFHILEPKPRLISAAPYRDRVAHHALCNIIAPLLEKTMIRDTYANRAGKGTHCAVERFDAFGKLYAFSTKRQEVLLGSS